MTAIVSSLRDPCSWCGRKHRAESLYRDPERLRYMSPEYARGRPARRGPWNAGLDDMLAEARAEQYDRGAAERTVGPDAYRWRP